MAFPTTSVLSSFTGADEDPLSEGGNWAGPILNGRGTLRRVSNQAAPGTAGNATRQSYWTVATFGPDTEVWGTYAAKGANGTYWDLAARIQSPNVLGAADMYQLEVTTQSGTDTWDIYRIVNDSGTLLSSVGTQEITAGNKIGFEVVGSGATVTLRAWYHNGTSWTQVGSDVTDTSASRITTAGYIGLEANTLSGAQRLDDFGGGTVVAGTTFAQALTATATTTATVVRSTGKRMSATATTAATIARQTAKTLTATATTTATAVKQTVKTLAATATSTASIARALTRVQTLTATATTTATLAKQTGKTIAATATSTATIVRQTGKTLATTATMTATVARQTAKTLTAAATSSATIARQTGKTLAATAAGTAAIVKTVGKSLSATTIAAASVTATRAILLALTATVNSTATITRQTRKTIAATATATATITKTIAKTLAATATTVASIVASFAGGGVTIVVGRFRAGRPAAGDDPGTPRASSYRPGKPGGGIE